MTILSKTAAKMMSSSTMYWSGRKIMTATATATATATGTATATTTGATKGTNVFKKLIVTGYPLVFNNKENIYSTTGKWILTTAGFVIAMINIGGITRLTHSGLSMTNWSITGSLPPITLEEWNIEFNKYKTFPEFQQRPNMTLSEFQYIYAWEYGHRMFGRLIGIVFIGPWIYFTMKRRIPIGYQPRMILLSSMGLTQGLVGWWMVKSGLTDDRRNDTKEIRVAPIRLATHLSMAVITYGTLLWTGMDILKLPHKSNRSSNISLVDSIISDVTKSSENSMNSNNKNIITKIIQNAYKNTCILKYCSYSFIGISGFTIISGAFVAGNDAGRAYNTFPKMHDDYWIPPVEELFNLQPYYTNLFNNTALVQLNHRILGTIVAISAIVLSSVGLSNNISSSSLLSSFATTGSSVVNTNKLQFILTPQVRNGLLAIGITSLGQMTLGITTLLTYVPISLAALHQLGSIAVFTSSIYLAHSLRYAILIPSSVVTNSATRTIVSSTSAASAATAGVATATMQRSITTLANTPMNMIVSKSNTINTVATTISTKVM